MLLIMVRSFLMANKNPKYAIKQIIIDTNCKMAVSKIDDNVYVITAIIAQPTSSGRMLPIILNGDKRIRKNIVIMCKVSIHSFVNVRARNIISNPYFDDIIIVGIITIANNDERMTDM